MLFVAWYKKHRPSTKVYGFIAERCPTGFTTEAVDDATDQLIPNIYLNQER